VTAELLDDTFGHGALRLARELRRRGKDVGLLCGGGKLAQWFRGIGIEPIVSERLRSPGRLLWLPRRLRQQVQAFGPDLIHLFGSSLAGWGRKLSRAADCPYVITVMTLPSRGRARLRADWRRGSVLALSEELREQLVNQGRVPKDVISVIPFGIDLDEYERFRAPEGRARTPVVGMVGPLTRERGCEVFLQAAREVLDRGHEAHFLLAGHDPGRAPLRRRIQRFHLEDALTAVHQFSDYRQMLAVMDICVFPGLRDDLDLNVLEAMACAKPVVATSVGGVYSLIADGETGLLSPPNDASALAERVSHLIENSAIADRIAQNALDQVRENFSIPASVERLLAFYSQCLTRVENP
jgi:glycosyltransferase involved in cell wall biosynthesis